MRLRQRPARRPPARSEGLQLGAGDSTPGGLGRSQGQPRGWAWAGQEAGGWVGGASGLRWEVVPKSPRTCAQVSPAVLRLPSPGSWRGPEWGGDWGTGAPQQL